MKKILCMLVISGMCCVETHAYLDGGTGSMILQLLIGGAVGLSAVAKMYWYKIKSFFVRSSSKDS